MNTQSLPELDSPPDPESPPELELPEPLEPESPPELELPEPLEPESPPELELPELPEPGSSLGSVFEPGSEPPELPLLEVGFGVGLSSSMVPTVTFLGNIL